MENDESKEEDAAASSPRESFVPSSLASFISKAQATLDDVQNSLNLESPAKSNASVSMDQDTSFASMREDEEDKKLKEEVLAKFNSQKSTQKMKQSTILETANLLLQLDEEEEQQTAVTAASTSPHATKTVDTPMSPPGEGVEFSMEGLLSVKTAVASPDNKISASAEKATPLAIDTNPERLSSGSRASGWKDLIASAPTRGQQSTPRTPVEQGIEFTESDLLSPDASSPARSPGSTRVDDITPKSVTKMDVAGSTSTPTRDEVKSASPPSVRATNHPMSMSCALEVTSPLEVKEEQSSNLSASNPELAPSSPWRNAFQSMAARLEDRAASPTAEASTLSSAPNKQSPSPSPSLIDDTSRSSTDKNASSPPQGGDASDSVPRKSGLVLSPSDSLPSPITNFSPKLLPADDKHSPASTSLVSSSASSRPPPAAMSPTYEEGGVERKNGLVLSPSDSLPSPHTRTSGLVLSPNDSLPKASPQSREGTIASTPSPVTSTSKASPQSKGEKEIIFPQEGSSRSTKASDQVVSSPGVVTSPQPTRSTGLVLSPSDSLPPRKSAESSDSISSPTDAPSLTVPVSNGKGEKRLSTPDAASISASSPTLAGNDGKQSEPLSLEKSAELPSTRASTTKVPSQSEEVVKNAAPTGTSSPSGMKSSPRPASSSGLFSSLATLISTPSTVERCSVSEKKASSPSDSLPRHSEVLAGKDEKPVPASALSAAKGAKDQSELTETASQCASSDVEVSPSGTKVGIAPVPSDPSSHQKPETLVSKPPTQVSTGTNDDSFLPNRRPVMTETPPVRPRAPARKSEASKRVTKAADAKDVTKVRKSMPTTKKSVDRSRISPGLKKTAVSQQGSTSSPTAGESATAKRNSTSTSTLSRGTASSEARAKVASRTPKSVVTNAKSVEDGRARARERVRKQKLEAEKKRKEAETKKSESINRTRSTKLTAEEGRALARERVRRLQVSSKGKVNGAVKGKENNSTSVSPTTNVKGSRGAAAKSPQLATKTKGEKSTGKERSSREGIQKLDPNPTTRALGSPTHRNDRRRDSTARSSTSSNRRLTVPKAPRLSTTAKYGDKPPPTLRTTRSTTSKSQPRPHPKKREFKATEPVPFKFHSTKTKARAPSQAASEPSLAERMEQYSRKGLREDSLSAPAVASKKVTLTLPRSPQFSAISKRSLPKSTAEMEEEMMEYYKAHPFKAAPVGIHAAAKVDAPKPVPKRRLTQPVPFHLRSDDRAAHSKVPIGSPNPEARDLEECKKQFHALPLPRSSLNPPPRKEEAPRSVTTPKPFNFSTDRRAAQSEPRLGQTPDDIELSKQFHARPIPQTTYAGPKSRSRSKQPVATPRQYAGPPKLATSARTEPREAARMASEKNAEKMAKQREEMAQRKKREKHMEDMARATLTSPPPNIEPFHLKSEQRHEAYQQHLAEQLAQEEEDKKRQMLFRAKPVKFSDPPVPIHSDRPATTPRPFALRSVSRHERWREERRAQLEAEEKERQRLMKVKAIPLPESTYKYSPVTPASQKKRQGDSKGDSEERDLDSARKKALEALETAENEMPSVDANMQGSSLLASITGS